MMARPAQAGAGSGDKSPLHYVWATAYHIPPETTTEESGYFSLCEGRNGKIYIGCAAYGRDSYLVEFDPQTREMRVVLDTHKLTGLPLTPTGYAAQSKIHTRNFVGPSGKIYVGTKQGYPTAAERAAQKRGEKIPLYKGGYVITYDPATGTAVNLGMPMPWGDPRLGVGETEGQGVIDVAADESRGLIYVITCEDQHWMLYDSQHPANGFRELQPGLALKDQPNTLIDKQSRATAITSEYKVARYDPATDKVTVDDLLIDGTPMREVLAEKVVHPDWRLAADGVTAYLQTLNDPRMFQIDLSGPAGQPVRGRSLGNRIEGRRPDSRGSIAIAPDGRVYSSVRIDNDTGFGKGYLHHLVRYDPSSGKMDDLGVYAVKNPDFFDFKAPPLKNPDGSTRPTHGFHTLPDGTLTPLHVIMATIVAHDGTVYATTIYPFTLLQIGKGDCSELVHLLALLDARRELFLRELPVPVGVQLSEKLLGSGLVLAMAGNELLFRDETVAVRVELLELLLRIHLLPFATALELFLREFAVSVLVQLGEDLPGPGLVLAVAGNELFFRDEAVTVRVQLLELLLRISPLLFATRFLPAGFLLGLGSRDKRGAQSECGNGCNDAFHVFFRVVCCVIGQRSCRLPDCMEKLLSRAPGGN